MNTMKSMIVFFVELTMNGMKKNVPMKLVNFAQIGQSFHWEIQDNYYHNSR